MTIFPMWRIKKWLKEKGITITKQGRYFSMPGKRPMQTPRFRRVVSAMMVKEGAY